MFFILLESVNPNNIKGYDSILDTPNYINIIILNIKSFVFLKFNTKKE